ncbi:MAG TPA: SWIM zinc finger family protein, partial [Minicystis sp.]|nr:SWIM zinc finger family protein [Minicystis sp.]
YRAAPQRAAAQTEVVKVWGRRRLFALARLLPLVTRLEVRLYGTGLPSVWIAHCGDVRLVLALSGWSSNDWAGGANLDVIAGDLRDDAATTAAVESALATARSASVGELAARTNAPREALLGALHRLAKQGQVVYDFALDRYRYRPVMPVPLADAVLGPEPAEVTEGRRLAAEDVSILSHQALDGGRVHVAAKVGGTSCEAIFGDGAIARAKCTCSFFHKTRLRAGPCRHLLALRLSITLPGAAPPAPAAPAASVRLAAPPSGEGADVFTLREDVLAAIEAAAAAEQRDASAVLEEAWDLASVRILGAASWDEAVALAPSARGALANGFVKPPLASRATRLHPDVVAEIGKVAQKLGASPSAVLNLAWLVHRAPRKEVKR